MNMRATFLAGGEGVGKGTVKARTIDLAPTLAFLLDIPEPQHARARCSWTSPSGGPATSRSRSSG